MNLPLQVMTYSMSALGLASTAAIAQVENQQPVTPPAAAAQETAEVTDQELQKFAEIYVDVETTRSELSEEMSQAATPEAAQDVQTRFEEELVATVEEHGWSVDEYNRVATAISNDPEKRERAVELISRLVS